MGFVRLRNVFVQFLRDLVIFIVIWSTVRI